MDVRETKHNCTSRSLGGEYARLGRSKRLPGIGTVSLNGTLAHSGESPLLPAEVSA